MTDLDAAVRHRCGMLLVVLGGLTVGCAKSHPDYPLTKEAVPFVALNEGMAGSAPPVAQGVTFDRLRNARSEPHNWLTYYGAYDGQRFSALDQINASNVTNLRPAWSFQAGVIGLVATPASYAFEAAPIVVDGVMYVSGFDGYVWALDAVTGKMLWQYRHAVALDVPLCCGNVNRGVAVANGKVFYAAPNANLVALDATTGRPLWSKVFADVRAGESSTMAPLVVKNLVIVGSSGAEYGVRGHLDAFDAETGRFAWRRYTVPKPGEPGSETWPQSGPYRMAWASGGGTTWITGTYDPELDVVYWGTGNPGPDYDGSVRPGDNLYTNSVLAMDPDDGAIKWHYQWTPHDLWDYDGIGENILFDQDGRKLLAHFDKNGHFFVIDRTNGQLVRVTRFGRATWGDIHETTGRVTPRITPTQEGVDICPGPAGLKEWPHAAYSRTTGLLYAPIVEQCATYKVVRTQFKESMAYWGGSATPKKDEQWGEVKAVDPRTGRQVWSWRFEHPIVASVLATAGELVFAGTPTGEFVALHALTGKELWRHQTGNGIHSNPVTYSVGGKQYVAVPTGWGGWMKGFAPELYGAPRGNTLMVFALP